MNPNTSARFAIGFAAALCAIAYCSTNRTRGGCWDFIARVLLAEEADSETIKEWKSQGVVSGNDEFPSSPYLSVPTDDSREQTELLLSGLVEKHNGYLQVKNPIYRSVFNAQWVVRQLDNLRLYSQTFNAWPCF